jgi:hypothetical protein
LNEADENSKSSDDGIDWDTVDKYAALSIYSDSSSMEEEDIPKLKYSIPETDCVSTTLTVFNSVRAVDGKLE